MEPFVFFYSSLEKKKCRTKRLDVKELRKHPPKGDCEETKGCVTAAEITGTVTSGKVASYVNKLSSRMIISKTKNRIS